jgi:hypothetical protein
VQEDRAQRRSLNIATTELLLHGVESGNFDYLLIGRDDTAPYSQAHKEARKMDILVRELPKEKIRFFSGADQLGLLLLSRAARRGKRRVRNNLASAQHVILPTVKAEQRSQLMKMIQ